MASAAAAGSAPVAAPAEQERTFRGARVPKGMVLPSRVQYHGTVFGLIAVGIVLVMVLGLLVSSGVGPFIASGVTVTQLTDISTGTSTATVTAVVTNRGTHAGQARCVALYTTGGGDLPIGAQSSHVSVDCK
jgi:hypothetical protein